MTHAHTPRARDALVSPAPCAQPPRTPTPGASSVLAILLQQILSLIWLRPGEVEPDINLLLDFISGRNLGLAPALATLLRPCLRRILFSLPVPRPNCARARALSRAVLRQIRAHLPRAQFPAFIPTSHQREFLSPHATPPP